MAAKIVLRAETPEEQEKLDQHMAYIGHPPGRRRLEILWTWQRVDRNRALLGAGGGATQGQGAGGDGDQPA